jgi:hypothetical protein
MTSEEIDEFVADLFDKDPPTAQPDNLPLPYSSETPPFGKYFGLLKLFPDWLLIFMFRIWSRTFTPIIRLM